MTTIHSASALAPIQLVCFDQPVVFRFVAMRRSAAVKEHLHLGFLEPVAIELRFRLVVRIALLGGQAEPGGSLLDGDGSALERPTRCAGPRCCSRWHRHLLFLPYGGRPMFWTLANRTAVVACLVADSRLPFDSDTRTLGLSRARRNRHRVLARDRSPSSAWPMQPMAC